MGGGYSTRSHWSASIDKLQVVDHMLALSFRDKRLAESQLSIRICC